MAADSFSLTAKQRDLRNLAASDAAHVLAFGGARSGKTLGFCYCIGVRALSAPASRHLIARLHHVDVRTAVMMDTWPKMMRLAHPAVPYELNKSGQFVRFANDSEVWFGGLDDNDRVEKVLGREYATIYFNECSQISYATVVTLRTRLAQNCEKVDGRPLVRKAYYDLNPTSRAHWTHREFIEGVRPDNGLPVDGGRRAFTVINPTDNPNLSEDFLAELRALPERQRQRYFDGRYQTEVPGALWPLERIDALRVAVAPQMKRIVVAVDPSGSDGSSGDSQGIVVAGLGVDGDGYVLADRSLRASPAGWARAAVDAYHEFSADKIVAEGNFGGAMVASTIRTADPGVPVRIVTASRGKHIRAEPIAALYETIEGKPGRVHHVGSFPALEEQMGMFTTAGYQGGGSPDRADALVWALTELMGAFSQKAIIAMPIVVTGPRPSPGA